MTHPSCSESDAEADSYRRTLAYLGFDAHKMPSLLRQVAADPDFQRATLRHNHPTHRSSDASLLQEIACGNKEAGLALYGRYLPAVEKTAAEYGKHALYSRDDAHHDAALVLLELAAGAREHDTSGAPFAARVKHTLPSEVGRRARGQLMPIPVPYETARLVRAALRECGFDLTAACQWVTTHPDPKRRLRSRTFFAAALTLYGHYLPDDEHVWNTLAEHEDEPEPALTATDWARLERWFYTAHLTEPEAAVLRCELGATGTTATTPGEIAELLGSSERRIRTLSRRARTKLRAVLDELDEDGDQNKVTGQYDTHTHTHTSPRRVCGTPTSPVGDHAVRHRHVQLASRRRPRSRPR